MFKTICAILFSGLVLVSCGTSKKLESANTQIAALNSQVASQQAKLAENDKQIADLKRANEINNRDAEDCRVAKEQLRRKKEAFEKELAARGTSVSELSSKAENAVRKLREAGHEVSYENGRFHIIVADEFGYQTGSASVGPNGREALNVVAQIMYDNPGVSAVVVGHTDTVSIRGKADNWSLSTERANAVVRVLENLYNINPKRLTAAGSSKFNPRATNDTEEGRALNRRIEIFLNPHLERVWSLLED